MPTLSKRVVEGAEPKSTDYVIWDDGAVHRFSLLGLP